MASKKRMCDRVQRKVAGQTRDEIMDAIYREFDLPRPKLPTRSEATAKPKPKTTPRKAKS